MDFEWDEEKRAKNLEKHGLDFNLATLIFDRRPRVDQDSTYPDEERQLSTALVGVRFMTVIWTPRGAAIRVISLRRARDAEKRAYRALHG